MPIYIVWQNLGYFHIELRLWTNNRCAYCRIAKLQHTKSCLVIGNCIVSVTKKQMLPRIRWPFPLVLQKVNFVLVLLVTLNSLLYFQIFCKKKATREPSQATWYLHGTTLKLSRLAYWFRVLKGSLFYTKETSRTQNGSGDQPSSYAIGTGRSSFGMRPPGIEADRSRPSRANTDGARLYTSIPPCAFAAWFVTVL
jgi:hypothetical protein